MLQLGLLTTVLIVVLWAISLMVKGPWTQVPTPHHGRLLRRMVVGSALVVVLTAVLILVLSRWIEGSSNTRRMVVVGIGFIALVGSLVMRSWWSMLAIPLSMIAASSLFLLWPERECVDCRPQEVPGGVWVIVFAGAFSGPIALVAALGTCIAVWVPRVYGRLTRRNANLHQ